MNPPDAGSISVDGQKIDLNSVGKAVELGIAYVPENRLVQGLVMEQGVSKNTIITVIGRMLKKTGLIDHERKSEKISELMNKFKIKVASVDAPVATLSGGNQQRVVLAKWMATNPRLLILDGPTVGIDIAAKGSIHELINQLAAEGIGVIIISDEVPEVLNSCHRVFVMKKGRMISEFTTGESTEDQILSCMESQGQGVMNEKAL